MPVSTSVVALSDFWMVASGMTRDVPRGRFHRSRLIRVLEDMALADLAESRQSLGDRLGQWLDFKDAISLYSVLHGGSSEGMDRSGQGMDVAGLRAEFDRVRASLMDAIRSDKQIDPSMVAASAHFSTESAVEFIPYHRSYLAHQRSMQTAAANLRTQVRMAASTCSPALRRLAALDGELERALGVRERGLLAALPMFLGKRFETLLTQAMEGGDDPAPGVWLAAFCRDVQTVLFAELDLRLQPALGLLEAFDKEGTGQR